MQELGQWSALPRLRPVVDCSERAMNTRKAENADIALVLEGTFPYVSGGVSSWVNQIIRAYPEYRFAIVFLGSRRRTTSEFKYQLPDNVVHFEEHYLYDNLNAELTSPPSATATVKRSN